MESLDYAPHYLEAKQSLKEVHDLLLKRRFIEAATKLDEVIVEVRLMRTAVKSHIKD